MKKSQSVSFSYFWKVSLRSSSSFLKEFEFLEKMWIHFWMNLSNNTRWNSWNDFLGYSLEDCLEESLKTPGWTISRNPGEIIGRKLGEVHKDFLEKSLKIFQGNPGRFLEWFLQKTRGKTNLGELPRNLWRLAGEVLPSIRKGFLERVIGTVLRMSLEVS